MKSKKTIIKIIFWAIGVIAVWALLQECSTDSPEYLAEKARKREAKQAEDAAWEKERIREFTVKPGEQATVFVGYRRFEFHHDGPIKAAAMVGSIKRTSWEEFHPESNRYLADPDDCEKVVLWNDGNQDVMVQFILLSRK